MVDPKDDVAAFCAALEAFKKKIGQPRWYEDSSLGQGIGLEDLLISWKSLIPTLVTIAQKSPPVASYDLPEDHKIEMHLLPPQTSSGSSINYVIQLIQ